jgi:hypothetical protein
VGSGSDEASVSLVKLRGFVLIVLIADALVLTAASASQPNFSGTWKMDATRSESAHQDVPIGPMAIVIQQTAGEFRVETRRSDRLSHAVTTETLTFKLDGTETTNAAASEVPVRVKAHWDGTNLVAETTREVNDSTITTKQVFELAPSGKQITIDKSLTVQHGYMGPGVQSSTGRGTDVFVKTDSLPKDLANK